LLERARELLEERRRFGVEEFGEGVDFALEVRADPLEAILALLDPEVAEAGE
jgi:hypothetical protein